MVHAAVMEVAAAELAREQQATGGSGSGGAAADAAHEVADGVAEVKLSERQGQAVAEWREPTAADSWRWLLMHLGIRDFFIYNHLKQGPGELAACVSGCPVPCHARLCPSCTAPGGALKPHADTLLLLRLLRLHPAAPMRLGGSSRTPPEWRQDPELFGRWVQGQTGLPFVDACMRELAATGYTSNRGRQNVASLLAKVPSLPRAAPAAATATCSRYSFCPLLLSFVSSAHIACCCASGSTPPPLLLLAHRPCGCPLDDPHRRCA